MVVIIFYTVIGLVLLLFVVNRPEYRSRIDKHRCPDNGRVVKVENGLGEIHYRILINTGRKEEYLREVLTVGVDDQDIRNVKEFKTIEDAKNFLEKSKQRLDNSRLRRKYTVTPID